ncbi:MULTISPECIES: APC family permease [unclassified Pseudomonas]|uniref:APC family permease n=1 Tax=unclassified Pseudomonas TaxID=196821 RepID=UPI00088EFCC0|nr:MULTISPECIES: APC family permease [unclassified Pseudomonas]SCZ13986.1 Amino acid permease [Pseudomonas sp. NFACC37-1]SFO48725.1 Amino acid permease [Pseudomonas sp. NFACC24-1]
MSDALVMPNEGRKLSKKLSLTDVIVYGLLYFGPIAPIPVFGAIHNISNGMSALTYAFAAIAMIFSAISYSEMAKHITLSGSVYSYVTKGTNSTFGFMAGWSILLDYLLLPALLAILGAAALQPLFPEIDKTVWLVLFVAVPLIVNFFGITVNVNVGKVLLIIQLVVLSIFVVYSIGLIADGAVSRAQLLAPFYNPAQFSISAVFSAVPIAALSFIGFDAVSTLNEEAKGGGKTVSKATMLLLVIVTVLFVAQVYLVSVFVPLGSTFEGADADVAFYTVSTQIVGAWFLPVITLTNALIALLANALTSQATTTKVIYCMARDKKLPSMLTKLNRNETPIIALYLVAALSLIIAILAKDHIEMIVTMVTFGALTAYVMLHISVVFFFKSKADKSFFKHVVSPVIGAAVLCYALFSANSNAQFVGVAWLLIGCVVAWILKGKQSLEIPV